MPDNSDYSGFTWKIKKSIIKFVGYDTATKAPH